MEQREKPSAVIAIFGSALPQEDSEQYRLAYELGSALAQAGMSIATGGHSGVMEAASRGAAEAGGHVIGVLAQTMPHKANRWITQRILVNDWEERLQKLIQIGKGYVALNGGTGTLVELAVAWEMMAKRIIPCRPLIALGDFWKPVVERITQAPEQVLEGLSVSQHPWPQQYNCLPAACPKQLGPEEFVLCTSASAFQLHTEMPCFGRDGITCLGDAAA